MTIFSSFKLILATIAWTSLNNAQLCTYTPANFIGSSILPQNAVNNLDELPDAYQYCIDGEQNNWKLGIDNGQSTDLTEEIDYDFLFCKEGFYSQGYLPLDSATGQVLGDSGVTIGAGVDLGAQTRAGLQSAGVETTILDQFDTYFGLQKSDAAEELCNEGPLILTAAQAQTVTLAVINNQYLPTVRTRYNNERSNDAEEWDNLPRCYRSVALDMYWVNGDSLFGWFMWQHIIANDWDAAIVELRTWGCAGSCPLRRYRALANIIESCETCGTSIDAVFLIDSSGSVSSFDFGQGLQFIADLINEFANGTQVGLSQFSSSYYTEFRMNVHNLDTPTGRQAAVTDVLNTIKISGGTYLASAISQLATDQFGVGSGVRDVSELVPRICIILTDGQSSDSPSTTVGQLTALGVSIIAIGIGGYSESQLRAITDNVFFLDDFDALVNIFEDISEVSCFVSAELPTGTISDVISISNGIIQYYRIRIIFNIGRRLQDADDDSVVVTVYQLEGCVYFYVSYCSQYPDEFSYDLKHEACEVENKTMIVPFYDLNVTCANTDLFLAVEGVGSGTNRYRVAIDTCSSRNDTYCKPGVNYVYENEVGNEPVSNNTIILNDNKVCVPKANSTLIDVTRCTNRTTERSCVGYFGLCDWIDFVTPNPTTTPSQNPLTMDTPRPTRRPSTPTRRQSTPTRRPVRDRHRNDGRRGEENEEERRGEDEERRGEGEEERRGGQRYRGRHKSRSSSWD